MNKYDGVIEHSFLTTSDLRLYRDSNLQGTPNFEIAAELLAVRNSLVRLLVNEYGVKDFPDNSLDLLKLYIKEIHQHQPIMRCGWRSFTCICGQVWAEPTRDRHSPSGECCPKCNDWCVPERQWADKELVIDSFGNLAS